MRRLCLIVGISASLALPVWAQQEQEKDGAKASRDSGATNAPNAPTSTNTTDAVSAPRRSLFPLPEPPRAKPSPAAASSSGEKAPGRLVPRYELAGGYSYVNFNPGDPFSSFNNHGETGSFTYNATRWLGLTGELSGYNFDRDVAGTKIGGGGWETWLFGPRLNLRRFDYFVPFAEFLVGGATAGLDMTGRTGGNRRAVAMGA